MIYLSTIRVKGNRAPGDTSSLSLICNSVLPKQTNKQKTIKQKNLRKKKKQNTISLFKKKKKYMMAKPNVTWIRLSANPDLK